MPELLPAEPHIRTLVDPADFTQAEQVQRETWGFGDLDIVPAAIFSVAAHFGGQALGAFVPSVPGPTAGSSPDRMVAFALSLGAVEEDGHPHLHSHMAAVIPEYQNREVGRKLKLAQRDDALRRGIDRIVWTFDPLQARNAHFNLVRLGGVGTRFLPNLYGQTSSPLHAGIPTDRLVIEWRLESPRVLQTLAGDPPPPPPDAIAVTIPAIHADTPPDQRLAAQTTLRDRLTALLHDGCTVTGFQSTEDTATYTLSPPSTAGHPENP